MGKVDQDKIVPRVGSGYPEPFRSLSLTRTKKRLGDAAGLTDFGVNLTRLPPGEWSSQRHWHTHEDEFVYVLEGELTMITDAGEEIVRAGECAAFPRNSGDGHHFINKSAAMAVYLEVGSRKPEDGAHYPDIDMALTDGRFTHKDGSAY